MKKNRTRDRILDISLLLFNSIGEPNVTTLLISDELDISPGNLYYHFRSKASIVSELYSRFEQEAGELLAVPADAAISLDQYAFFVHVLFETVARYRFLYRDLVNVLSRYPQLQPGFRRLLDRKHQAFEQICRSLRQQEQMQIDEEELDGLCRQLTLTACYWVSFDSLSHPEEPDTVDLGRGVYQMLNLIRPYLVPEAQQYVRLISRDYS